MTYEDIANWAEEHIPQSQFNNYAEWKEAVESEFLNSGHFFPEQVYPLLQESWDKNHEEKQEPVYLPPEPERTESAKLFRRIDRLPQDVEFTPKQISSYSGVNYNTVRRELQEGVLSGELQRVRIGVYRKV